MQRREFIRRAASGLAACAAGMTIGAVALEAEPSVYSDGVHDDTEALQWRLDRGMDIKHGRHYLSRHLVVRGPQTIEGNIFYGERAGVRMSGHGAEVIANMFPDTTGGWRNVLKAA